MYRPAVSSSLVPDSRTRVTNRSSSARDSSSRIAARAVPSSASSLNTLNVADTGPPSVSEKNSQVVFGRGLGGAADDDERQRAEGDADFHGVDAVRREGALQGERPDQAAEEAGDHAADRAFPGAAAPVQAEHHRHEEEAGDEFGLLDHD